MKCGGCSCGVDKGDEQYCWFCDSVMCFKCWDDVGHCGHEEAVAINEAGRQGGPEMKARLIRALLGDGPEVEHLVDVPEEDVN